MIRSWGSGPWAPGRIVKVARRTRDHFWFKVATSLHSAGIISGTRVIPAGTPIYLLAGVSDLRLIASDPDWDPYAIEPFMTPEQFEVLGGARQFPNATMPGLTHVGSYLPATDYDDEDPIWAWEAGWRRGVVMSSKRSWVAVRYVDGFRLRNGYPCKSYRPDRVWPVICDHPEPVRTIQVDEESRRRPDPRTVHAVAIQLGFANRDRFAAKCNALGGCDRLRAEAMGRMFDVMEDDEEIGET